MANRSKPSWYAKDLKELAAFLGVSPNTIRHWFRRPDWPARDEERGFDLAKVHRWMLEREKAKTKPVAAGDGDDKSAAQLAKDKLAVDVETRKLRLMKEAGELVLRKNAYATIEQMFHRVRTRLQAIPEELASSLPAEVRAEYVHDGKHKIRLILTEMANWGIAED